MDNFVLDFFTKPENAQNPYFVIIFYFLIIWSLIIKGIALYHAARHEEKIWFIGLLFINTLGILEIIYLFFLSNEKMTTEQTLKDFKKLNSEIKFQNPFKKIKGKN